MDLLSAPKRIDDALRKAKRAAKERFEVTGQAQKAHEAIELDGHHLFDPVKSRSMARHQRLLQRLSLLQANYEHNHLRYHFRYNGLR
jgi:hypothetical protein